MLADLFEKNAEFWLDLQAIHDRWEARQKHDKTHKLPPIHTQGCVSHA
jgi:plasmid maintenance system antidote protein VapI